jgi:hypothetical protein
MVDAPTDVTLRTFSYAGNGAILPGGFDPALAVFDSSGFQLGANDDGGSFVQASPISGFRLDSYVKFTLLPAGVYYASLTESPNTANGPGLLDGFAFVDFSRYAGINQIFADSGTLLAGSSDFTCSMFLGRPGAFCDELLEQLDSHYALDIEGVSNAAPIPEPAAVLLLATVILALVLLHGRRAFERRP